MSNRKSELQKIVEDIVFQRLKLQFPQRDLHNLKIEVSKVLETNAGTFDPLRSSGDRLSQSDRELVEEIFWDLFIERIITVGEDGMSRAEPSYRLHSEWRNNLKRRAS
jgi:hypothetical protein